MIMAWQRNWKMSSDLIFLGGYCYNGSSVKSTSPVASWECPRTERAVPSFSLAGSFLPLFYALFLVISLSLITVAPASTHLSWTPNSSILNWPLDLSLRMSNGHLKPNVHNTDLLLFLPNPALCTAFLI